jgi:murein DD-endopeptidase MepM/ murein hydrolase activator NlpD
MTTVGVMSRAAVTVLCAALALAAGLGGTTRATSADRAGGQSIASIVAYSAPVGASVVVVRAFVAPSGPYAAGHRGVDLATTPGELVLAAAEGQVRFAGMVAGRGVVVIEHPDGVLTEYEPVTPSVRAGAQMARGQPIGRIHGGHLTCGPSRCLHWAARRDGAYYDPMTLLARLGPVRLLPWRGGVLAR